MVKQKKKTNEERALELNAAISRFDQKMEYLEKRRAKRKELEEIRQGIRQERALIRQKMQAIDTKRNTIVICLIGGVIAAVIILSNFVDTRIAILISAFLPIPWVHRILLKFENEKHQLYLKLLQNREKYDAIPKLR